MGESSNVCKRLRVNDTDGEDIISNLPESIISHILSILPTKDAVRTCVLSKDWEYKWTRIYNLNIDDSERLSERRPKRKSVVDFVDRILLVSQHSNIKTFRLSLSQRYNPDRIMTWMSAVLLRHVESVEIEYKHRGCVVSRCLFYCTSLRKMKLQMRCTLRIPIQYWFSNLEMLHLNEVKIERGFVSDTSPLILNFPVLVTLELESCTWWGMNFVEVKAPALTKCKLSQNAFFPVVEKSRIKICGAKLVKFDFYSNFADYFDLSASTVSSAEIDFPTDLFGVREIEGQGLPFRHLMRGFLGLKHLEITGEIVEAISRSNQGPPVPRFNELKRLELYRKCSGGALIELLHAMPFLESVSFDMSERDEYNYDEVESVPPCIAYHLKEVRFVCFKGKRPHVNMANFLLTNAVRLKKMSGLRRIRSRERRTEKDFWRKLKNMFEDGDFDVGSTVKTMVDFERLFG